MTKLKRLTTIIFEGVFSHAGKIRDYNISKREWVLDGASVNYGNALELKEMLEYDMQKEREYKYAFSSSFCGILEMLWLEQIITIIRKIFGKQQSIWNCF